MMDTLHEHRGPHPGDADSSPCSPKVRVLYVSSSSYSGSTLLAFLLNLHPDIFTVSEMDGWRYDAQKGFTCSCGAHLRDCPFFRTIAAAFPRHALPFDFREFGTRYSLARNDRLDRYLTAELPRVSSTLLEKTRDRIVQLIPPMARRLAHQDKANLLFMREGLAYAGASVFVDACKSPFRLRHLRRIHALDLRTLYLVRDPRGVVLSNRVKHGWDARLAMRLWIRQQADIERITGESPPILKVYYEDLCDRVNDTLMMVHRFLAVEPQAFGGDFRAVEHHILGNWMRLSNVGAIQRDTRWQRELSSPELETISSLARAFVKTHERHPVSATLRYYLDREVE